MLEQLKDIIVNYVEVKKEDIKPESRFIEDLGFTSFDFMKIGRASCRERVSA